MLASRRAWLAAAGVVFCLALGARLPAVHEIRAIGFFKQPVSDGRVYVERARGIVAGDWLGPADFVHAPLYAYYLAGVQLIAGESPAAPRIAQALGGALACVLLLAATTRLFGLRVGCVAGILLALYPPAIFFDLLIQKASLTLLLSTAVLWLVVRTTQRPTWWGWLLTGAALGLFILNRQNALVLVPLLAGWAWLGRYSDAAQSRQSPPARATRRRLVWAVLLVLGAVVPLVPWAARNRVVVGEWTLTTPNLGQNFAMGNHPDATGTYLPQRRGHASGEQEQAEWVREAERAAGRALTPREVSDYYLTAALAWVRANPAAWLRLTLRKCGLTWGAYELPDTEDYYLYQEHAGVLRGLDRVWHFGVLAPLAAAGVVLTAGQWRHLWWLYGWLLLTTLAVAVFVVFARYRLPLVPVLVIFAAAALGEAAARLRVRRYGGLVGAAVVTIVVAGLANWPLGYERRPDATAYRNHAVVLADEGRAAEALAELDRAARLAPNSVDVHLTRGSVLLDLGRYQEALAAFEAARAGEPEHARTYRGLGDSLVGLSQVDEAITQYERAVALDPGDYVSLNCLAAAHAQRGDIDTALALFERVLAAAPDYPEAYLNLGNTWLHAGEPARAVAAYETALRLRPEYADAAHNLAAAQAALAASRPADVGAGPAREP